MGQWIELSSHDGFALPAWEAQPSTAPRGAIVVLQEIFGINDHIRSVVDRFAARGFYAIAPSTFARIQPNVELGYSANDMQAGMVLKADAEALPAPGVLADIQSTIAHAAQASGCKVGIVGFCWGGLLTWRAACLLQGLSAAVPYYGGGMTSPTEAARHPQVPVLAHFGEYDSLIAKDSVLAFAQAQPHVQVHLYAADHGFNCDQRASYDDSAALLARDRTLAFLDQHLAA